MSLHVNERGIFIIETRGLVLFSCFVSVIPVGFSNSDSFVSFSSLDLVLLIFVSVYYWGLLKKVFTFFSVFLCPFIIQLEVLKNSNIGKETLFHVCVNIFRI